MKAIFSPTHPFFGAMDLTSKEILRLFQWSQIFMELRKDGATFFPRYKIAFHLKKLRGLFWLLSQHLPRNERGAAGVVAG